MIKVYSLLFSLLLLLECEGTGTGHRHHTHMGGHHTPKPKAEGGMGVLKDEKLIGDVEHLKEDLSAMYEELTPEQIEKMTPRELEYHYFRVHDYDKNFKLDGLELLSALGHVVHHPDEQPGEIDLKFLRDAEIMIDEVIEEHDRNNDGFLTFAEYSLGKSK